MRAWPVLLCLVMGTGSEVLGSDRPNILHIHADDLRADGAHALGSPALKTPNFDQLIARGTTFTRCYTQGSMMGAVCLPSRTMLLTGRSWLRINQTKNPAEFLPSVLKARGYVTWHMGKGGNEFRPALQQFSTNLIDDARSTEDGPESRSGSSRRHADAVLDFLGKRDKSQPFYLYIAPPVPHDPRIAEAEFHKMYRPEEIPLPPAFAPLHPWDNGEMTVRDEALAPWPRTADDTRRQLAEYYACISALDHHVGRILKHLEASGELSKTIVVLSSDNGLSMGEHGLFGKQNLYEYGGMHVPLVMAGPGIPQGRSDALVYLMDLFPTFCDLASAAIPTPVEGKSLVPILKGQQSSVRKALYTGYRDVQRSIRDDRWKLIVYPQVDRRQLFDLANDPRELNNLADRPDQAERIKALMTLLQQEMKSYGDTAPLQVDHPRPAAWSPPRPAAKGARVSRQTASAKPSPARKELPVKVFVLAGQSNMQGQAVADLDGRDYNGGKGTLKTLLRDPARAPLLAHLQNKDGSWSVRDDVWVRYQREDRPLKKGPLTVGFAVYDGNHHFGPELQFGQVIGNALENPVMIIKTAWGGKSLAVDFRPPSSGGAVGPYYRKMLDEIREGLARVGTDFPELEGKRVELAGFVWYQGWNDGVDPKKAVPEYQENLIHLIHDLRKDLKSPNLPVVVGELTGPWVDAPGAWYKLRQAQKSATLRDEFKGNVAFASTRQFVRNPEDSPNPGHGHHEFGNAETYFLVGDALGKSMLSLIGPQAGAR